VVFLGTLAFALHSARNIPLFCLTALPLLAVHLDPEWRALSWRPAVRLRLTLEAGDLQARAGGWTALFGLIWLVLLLGSGRLAGVPVIVADYDPKIFPVEAVRRAREARLQGRIFNQFIWGGYILYAWPEQRVFIDGQTDFYGERLTRTYAGIAGIQSGWPDSLAANRISLLIIPTSSLLGARIIAEPNWHLWYRDSLATIFTKVR
jgi:hypothetical protein